VRPFSSRGRQALVAKSGTALFVSAQSAAVGEVQRRAIRAAFERTSSTQLLAEPVDWLTNPWPQTWKLNGELERFDWG
jgi:alpha-galactosidase